MTLHEKAKHHDPMNTRLWERKGISAFYIVSRSRSRKCETGWVNSFNRRTLQSDREEGGSAGMR